MKLRRFELALALTMAVLFTYAAAVSHAQNKMADGLLRLHVVANSDLPHDQAVKLKVRDAVLEFCAPLLEDAENRTQVQQVLHDNMQEIVNHAQETLWQVGEKHGVKAKLAAEYYPTREYATFSLPAGEYLGLRLTIGDGVGKNWWCVVFPPLCSEVATAQAEYEQRENLLAKEKPTRQAVAQTYTVRFKTAELIGTLRQHLFAEKG